MLPGSIIDTIKHLCSYQIVIEFSNKAFQSK